MAVTHLLLLGTLHSREHVAGLLVVARAMESVCVLEGELLLESLGQRINLLNCFLKPLRLDERGHQELVGGQVLGGEGEDFSGDFSGLLSEVEPLELVLEGVQFEVEGVELLPILLSEGVHL